MARLRRDRGATPATPCMHYGWALGVLGLGWNLLFIAATTMLTKTYRTHERIQAQTLNDFLVFGAQAAASLLAGLAVTTIGWGQLNLATLPLLARGACWRRSRSAGRGGPRAGLDPVEEGCGFRATTASAGSSQDARRVGRELEHRLGDARLTAAACPRRSGGARPGAGWPRVRRRRGAAAAADQVDAPQAQLVDQVDDREREAGNGHAALSVRPSRRCPAGPAHRPSGRCRAARRSG